MQRNAWEASWQGCFSQRNAQGGRDFSGMLFSGLPVAAELSGEIIPGRAFLCRGMHFAEGNHPWESFFLQRDAFRRRKASLKELFTAEGCISQKEIISGRAFFCRGMHFAQKESIPGRAFSCRGMHFAEGNHPWKSFFLLRDALHHRIVIPDRVSS